MSDSAGERAAEPSPPPRLPVRQRTLLALLRACGGDVEDRDCQKLLFLYGLDLGKGGGTPPYDFVPHTNGAFSFTAAADRDRLVGRGILNDGESWQLTPAGDRLAATYANRHTTLFALRHRDLRGDALVAETYRQSPFHASRSRIADRVLDDEPATRERIAAARSVGSTGPLVTVGYEGRSYEGYFNELLKVGVSRLCDVRRSPMSRKWGFSMRTLADGCRHLGIKYESLPELGIASERRADLNGAPDYDRLFDDYEATTLKKETGALDRILTWIKAGDRVALTCYERDFRECHRSRAAGAIAARSSRPFLPKHL